jgi:cold shock CspA family protein
LQGFAECGNINVATCHYWRAAFLLLKEGGAMARMETQSGTVVAVFLDRGFGFIQLETGEDIYFHGTACITPPDIKDLKEGMDVCFSIVKDNKGRKRAIGLVME